MKLEFYVLVHEHEYGQTLYGFYYQPTKARPYPSVLRVVEKLGVDYDRTAGESASLHTVEGGEPDLILLASEVGSRGARILGHERVEQDGNSKMVPGGGAVYRRLKVIETIPNGGSATLAVRW